MATASVTLALNQSSFLAGIARAQSSVSALGAAVGRIGSRGFLIAGTAAVAFGTAAAVGIKKAFDLGGRLADMSAISGRSAKSILLMTRALSDAGVSMEKIDRFILTGQDRGMIIANALKSITAGDWADAAKSIGTQADVLDKNAATFDRVSDLLGRSGDKLQGFFVGAAGQIGKALLPILEKFDKLDFASQGAKFGAGLLLGAQALAGFFKKPELLFKSLNDYFQVIALNFGNVLTAVFKTSIDFFKNGMSQSLVGLGSAIAATLIESFKSPIAYLQAGVEHAMEFNTEGRTIERRIGHLQDLIASAEQDAATEKPGSGAKASLTGASLEDAEAYKNTMQAIAEWKKQILENEKALQAADKRGLETIESRAQRILKQGVKFGIDTSEGATGLTSGDYQKMAAKYGARGLEGAATAASNFEIKDVFGASEALKKANLGIQDAAQLGRGMLPTPMAAGNRTNRKGGGITVAGGGNGLTDMGATNFLGTNPIRQSIFEQQAVVPQAAVLGSKKSETLLEKLAASVDKLNGTTEEAWGD